MSAGLKGVKFWLDGCPIPFHRHGDRPGEVQPWSPSKIAPSLLVIKLQSTRLVGWIFFLDALPTSWPVFKNLTDKSRDRFLVPRRWPKVVRPSRFTAPREMKRQSQVAGRRLKHMLPRANGRRIPDWNRSSRTQRTKGIRHDTVFRIIAPSNYIPRTSRGNAYGMILKKRVVLGFD